MHLIGRMSKPEAFSKWPWFTWNASTLGFPLTKTMSRDSSENNTFGVQTYFCINSSALLSQYNPSLDCTTLGEEMHIRMFPSQASLPTERWHVRKKERNLHPQALSVGHDSPSCISKGRSPCTNHFWILTLDLSPLHNNFPKQALFLCKKRCIYHGQDPTKVQHF